MATRALGPLYSLAYREQPFHFTPLMGNKSRHWRPRRRHWHIDKRTFFFLFFCFFWKLLLWTLFSLSLPFFKIIIKKKAKGKAARPTFFHRTDTNWNPLLHTRRRSSTFFAMFIRFLWDCLECASVLPDLLDGNRRISKLNLFGVYVYLEKIQTHEYSKEPSRTVNYEEYIR